MIFILAVFLISCEISSGFAPVIKTKQSSLSSILIGGKGISGESLRKTTELNGIPKMFRWLTDQYPSISRQLREGLKDVQNVDNFYLDMNGIIHPCTHGNSDDLVVLDETEMFKKIFLYVDRLYKLVRPRNVLYLAVDGVAPRAKMNQQRSRRFRSGKEAEELMAQIVARDGELPKDVKKFDSNCITPGTDFMLKLSLAMNKWIEFKQRTDPFWKNGATVIFSGPDVPGEGEHKVMDYIREYQLSADYDSSLVHILYGLDADLIMLGLVTHEKRFMLLREKMSVVMSNRKRRNGRKPKDMLEYEREDFELLQHQTLRQMFQIQFRKFADGKVSGLLEEYSNDRIIDDFVFMCMLVGNDFLTHMPHMEIDSGALSLMLSTYTDLLPKMGGYLTDKEKIDPERFELFLSYLMPYEAEHFQRRSVDENEERWALPDDGSDDGYSYKDYYYHAKLKIDPDDPDKIEKRRAIVRDYLEGLHWILNYYHNGCSSWDWFYPHLYSPLCTDMDDLREFYEDDKSDSNYKSMPFESGITFSPLVQLLSVLPPQSAALLPESYQRLMLSTTSPLAPYYPAEFTADANGKRQPWEAVVQIPFIDSQTLLDAVQEIKTDDEENQLTKVEIMRDQTGVVHTYVPEFPGMNGDMRIDMRSGKPRRSSSRKKAAYSKRSK